MLSSKTLKIVLVAAFSLGCMSPAESQQRASVERMNPILAVEAIEPILPFWEALGFTPSNPSRIDGVLVFIEFVKDGHAVHYQTVAQIEEVVPAARDMLVGSTSMIYFAVDDLDLIIAGLGDAEVVIPRRSTAWGADEIYVKEPGGHIIGFAQFGSD